MRIAKPGLEDFCLEIEGEKIIGGFYYSGIPQAPTFILIHGIPGIEKNLYFANEFQKRGWNTLYFHYRGSWGSSGSYNIHQHQQDIHAAYEWLQNKDYVDTSRISLIGSSLGGYNTLSAISGADSYFTYIALCPLIDVHDCKINDEEIENFSIMLQGVSGKQLLDQWRSLPSIIEGQAAIKQKNVLLLTGDRDDLFPPQHYETLVKNCPNIVWKRNEMADHTFSGVQDWVIKEVCAWFEEKVST